MKTTRGRRWWLLLSARCHVRSASLATLVCSAAAHRFETHAIGQRGHRFAHEPRCASQRQHLRCELLACHVPAEEGGGQNWPDRADHRHRSSFRRYCTPHSLQGAILSNPVLRPTSTSACAGSDMADSLREEGDLGAFQGARFKYVFRRSERQVDVTAELAVYLHHDFGEILFGQFGIVGGPGLAEDGAFAAQFLPNFLGEVRRERT